jgi:4,5-DOPA dioxygenase extradiol
MVEFMKLITRRKFIRTGTISVGALSVMGFSELQKITGSFPATGKMPVLFAGHGNPMNAIIQNEFHNTWVELGKTLPRPKAILSVSAHWLTHHASYVTVMHNPKTIHDFGGFPDALFDQQYPAPGAPEFAEAAIELVRNAHLKKDVDWGLDHGTWSVLLPMFPDADIPVFQLSIDYHQAPDFHFELAKELKALREKGVMIMGSGNIVHNLKMMRHDNNPYDWALDFDAFVREKFEKRDFSAIVNFLDLGSLASMAHPTIDHFLPLLYSLGVLDENEEIITFNESFDLGSVSMWSFYSTKG